MFLCSTVGLLEKRHLSISDLVSTWSLDLLIMTDTHIFPTGSGSLLHSITPLGYILSHRPPVHNLGGSVAI